jgi:hypothetical protein
MIGNLLEVIKYKITALKLSQLTKGILQKETSMYEWRNRRKYGLANCRNFLFATKISSQQVSQDLPTYHMHNNHVKDKKCNSQKNLHNSGRSELTTSRAKRMSPWK